ncbi:hypothetical protein AB0P07_08220 [Streptomyces sp. NPDC085944]|uniref:hypothetical protein n=1 Tax=Streptomyces sp. NPDC085944 TaxID=3154962 RepID=UPI0034237A15
MTDLPHTDAMGAPLAEGDRVAIATFGPEGGAAWATGTVVMFRSVQVVIDSGGLVVFEGRKLGGNLYDAGRPTRPDQIRHSVLLRMPDSSDEQEGDEQRATIERVRGVARDWGPTILPRSEAHRLLTDLCAALDGTSQP